MACARSIGCWCLWALVSSCALQRSPIRPDDDLDAPMSMRDVPTSMRDVPPGEDAGDPTLDAPTGSEDTPVDRDSGPEGCAPACTDGRICVGTTCECPLGSCCPGCAMGTTCVAGACTACGTAGAPCCGSVCGPGAECSSGTCAACGGESEACCGGTTCRAPASCATGRCMTPPPPCGAQGQLCCPGFMCDPGDLVCDRSLISPARCIACGDTGEACCGTRCNGMVDSCVLGACRVCGTPFGPCCADDSCLFGSHCEVVGSAALCIF